MKGLWGWLFQRVTGVLLVAGLLVHFIIMHYSGPEQITYAFVMARFSNPLWKLFDLAFLLSVIYHGFNGVWGIVLEYISSESLRKACQVGLLTAASVLAAAGIYILTV